LCVTSLIHLKSHGNQDDCDAEKSLIHLVQTLWSYLHPRWLPMEVVRSGHEGEEQRINIEIFVPVWLPNYSAERPETGEKWESCPSKEWTRTRNHWLRVLDEGKLCRWQVRLANCTETNRETSLLALRVLSFAGFQTAGWDNISWKMCWERLFAQIRHLNRFFWSLNVICRLRILILESLGILNTGEEVRFTERMTMGERLRFTPSHWPSLWSLWSLWQTRAWPGALQKFWCHSFWVTESDSFKGLHFILNYSSIA
jgi:hypothetical protein